MDRGLSFKRYKEWYRATRASRTNLWGYLILALIPIFQNRIDRFAWRKRVRACLSCPYCDKEQKVCMGCGCYVPFKAAYENQRCWADEQKEKSGKNPLMLAKTWEVR